MLTGFRYLGPLLVTAASLPVVLATVPQGLDRLASMPTGVRLELTRRLDRFDLLPDDRQRQIRELDDALNRLDPDERRRHLDLMRRFGAWYRGLDERARAELDAAPAADRLRLVERMLAPAGVPESPGLEPALWVRADAFNPVPLYDASALLRVWAGLDADGRRAVDAARSFDGKLETLRGLGRAGGIEPAPAVRREFERILQAQLGQGLRRFRELFDEQDRPPRAPVEPGGAVAWLLDAFGSTRSRPPGPAASRLASARLAALRLAELDYLRGLRGRPGSGPPADRADLSSFEARLPDWYRGTLDLLPPEVARLRLRGLRELALGDPELERWLSSAPSPPGTSPASNAPGGGRPAPGTAF
ncbi:hypothetical protein [Tautonia plasticadhaerens]|uniref:Uncharacterized protein n=1 Tax=Tautonia plasticadhaerens TaxID=2527974 RepID=A0A518HB50_9BACT|nr:hypothetical protein [Tautonia plasticadhaerens]QDV38084.1 hypothetical protein ElP_60320 [Tautonia plasticadhaerens]